MKRFLFAVLVAVMAVSCYDDTDLQKQIEANRQSIIDLKAYIEGQPEVILPKLKIDSGSLKVSYDGGANWEEVGAVSSSTEECLVESVTLDGDVLVLVLSDGQSFNIPLSAEQGPQEPQGGVRSYYLDEIAKTRASVNNLITEPCLVFPMITDIHYKSSSECPDLIDITMENMVALSKDIRFDFFACLGDITDGKKSQEET
ncbi:MAG: hypothetical protein E7123_09195, partial [Bacteroidales bacterium]|nr:hypothetical protein [Bacteroidales bacterium]